MMKLTDEVTVSRISIKTKPKMKLDIFDNLYRGKLFDLECVKTGEIFTQVSLESFVRAQCLDTLCIYYLHKFVDNKGNITCAGPLKILKIH